MHLGVEELVKIFNHFNKTTLCHNSFAELEVKFLTLYLTKVGLLY